MTDAKRELHDELIASGLERREVRWLLEEFYVDSSPESVFAVRAAGERRRAGEPLQYVIGHWPFRGLDVDVDPRVLIPRPETEELVGRTLDELARDDHRAPLILDLGCGSGAIGLSLLMELGERGVAANLVGVDASSDAIDVARQNARKHGLGAVSFVLSSWFDNLDESLRGRFDAIVANPPYVGESELNDLDPVLGHEPRAALVSSDAHGVVGFADVEHIIAESRPWLARSGFLVLEHGHAQRDAALKACRSAGFSTFRDFDDVSGYPRMLVARQ